jgi:hypothetical protein
MFAEVKQSSLFRSKKFYDKGGKTILVATKSSKELRNVF